MSFELRQNLLGFEEIPESWKPLTPRFFTRPAPAVAEDLIGIILLVRRDKGFLGGMIVETEAYTEDDPASHTHKGRKQHNNSMFETPGTIYVYRSYGIHWCMNISTGVKDRGEGVLLRALSPLVGVSEMKPGARSELSKILSGPGRLTQALSVDKSFDGQMMGETNEISLWKTPSHKTLSSQIIRGPRIGISKAVDTPWRFGLARDPSLSRPFPKA